MAQATRSGSTRAMIPSAVRSARRNRKLAAVAASCAIAAVATVGLVQPFLLAPEASQAAAAYQPSLADITRANAQVYTSAEAASGQSGASQAASQGSASLTEGRNQDVTVKLETPAPEPAVSASSLSPDALPSGISYDSGTLQATAQSALAAAGYTGSEWGCYDYIISRESGWNPNAQNSSTGAYGLGQSIAMKNDASYRADAGVQISWALNYMVGRYGSPCGAYDFWQNNGWY